MRAAGSSGQRRGGGGGGGGAGGTGGEAVAVNMGDSMVDSYMDAEAEKRRWVGPSAQTDCTYPRHQEVAVLYATIHHH